MILTLLMFALGVPLPIMILIWMIGVVCEKPPQPPVVNVNVPQSPVQRWSGAVPGQPGGDSSTWAQYAMRNPEVKLQIVEKYEVADGRFTAEKHMRMTGPVPPQRVLMMGCVMPGPSKKWRNNVGQM